MKLLKVAKQDIFTSTEASLIKENLNSITTKSRVRSPRTMTTVSYIFIIDDLKNYNGIL